MPYVEAGEGRIHFRSSPAHADAAETIVWGHGFLLDSTFYDKLIARLPDYRHVIVDHRGHGRSDAVASNGTLQRMADDIGVVISHQNIERFAYVGHSMGAAIGWRLAQNHHDRLWAGVSIAGIPVSGKLDEARSGLLAMIDMAGDEDAMTAMIAPLYADPAVRDAASRTAGIAAAQVPRSIIEEIVTDQFHLHDSGSLMSALTQPWLFIVPSDDLAEPAWYQLRETERFADARSAVLEGQGHMAPQERPDLVAAPIAEFLASVKRQPG